MSPVTRATLSSSAGVATRRFASCRTGVPARLVRRKDVDGATLAGPAFVASRLAIRATTGSSSFVQPVVPGDAVGKGVMPGVAEGEVDAIGEGAGVPPRPGGGAGGVGAAHRAAPAVGPKRTRGARRAPARRSPREGFDSGRRRVTPLMSMLPAAGCRMGSDRRPRV